jgi:exopolysaccharide biosynthesis WecB/TagA/CpsF family protein
MPRDESHTANPRKVSILNIEIENVIFDEFVKQKDLGMVVTPNVDHLVKLQTDHEFYRCYQDADRVVCDSRIVQWISWLLHPRQGIPERINGADFLLSFCRYHGRKRTGLKIFLLGGTEESVVLAGHELDKLAGNPIVVGTYSPPFGFEHSMDERKRIIEMINGSGANALAVGVGAPKQEKWIWQCRSELPDVTTFLAIGAGIEFAAGTLSRAPAWVGKAGLEWFYRLLHEPRRLARRYLVEDPLFFWLALKQRFGLYRNPWS